MPSAPENLENRAWFQDAKFGLFLHWGLYSIPGEGEWVMDLKKMSIGEYESLAAQFNPVEFDPAAWVSLARRAGMKYIVITSKHHDGFALWGTRQNRYNAVDGTPYRGDILRMIADECHQQGVKLFFYYSQLDWRHPDYYPRGLTGHASGREESGDFPRYLDYMDAQLTELLTLYGEIGGIWFDGMWDKPDADWRLDRTYSLIHRLQPGALIGSNHHKPPFDEEDFQMFEKDLPGENTSGFGAEAVPGSLPLECCGTMGDSWGYSSREQHFKSATELIHFLVRSAGNNANFLLNIGPMPDGRIQPEFVERLEEIGRWMAENGESIYGTRGGPLAPAEWGVTTQTDSKVFIHLLDREIERINLPSLRDVGNPRFLDGSPVPWIFDLPGGWSLDVPKRDSIDTIIVFDKIQ